MVFPQTPQVLQVNNLRETGLTVNIEPFTDGDDRLIYSPLVYRKSLPRYYFIGSEGIYALVNVITFKQIHSK